MCTNLISLTFRYTFIIVDLLLFVSEIYLKKKEEQMCRVSYKCSWYEYVHYKQFKRKSIKYLLNSYACGDSKEIKFSYYATK